MEFPFGHHHHHHHRGGEEDREEQPYPPPGQRPDPYFTREYQGAGEEYRRPPPYGRQEEGYYGEDTYPRPPPPSGMGYGSGSAYPPVVQHVAHETNPGPYPHSGYGREEQGGRYGGSEGNHGHRNSFTSAIHHYTHESPGVIPSSMRTVRVFTKAEGNYSLTIRDGKVVLALSNPNDEYQHWIKDEKYSTKVKDEQGFPSFALVNKVTGEAIKHSVGAQHPVRLVQYNPEYLDESILWTESTNLGDGFRCIRMVNNIRLNFDAFHGDADHGGVRDGTTIVLWEWLKGENQRWMIVPY